MATMPSDKMRTLPAAVTVVAAPNFAALSFAATLSALAALAAALTGVVAASLRGCAEDCAKAGMAIKAQLEIKVSLTRQDFTRVPNGRRDQAARRGHARAIRRARAACLEARRAAWPEVP